MSRFYSNKDINCGYYPANIKNLANMELLDSWLKRMVVLSI